jgi:hypothetical protein
MANHTPVPKQFKSTAPPATEPQLRLINTLAAERQLDEDHHVWLREQLHHGVTKSRAHDIIERLLARPKLTATQPKPENRYEQIPSVPDGHYALEEPVDELNTIRFYLVRHGKQGTRWENYTFVDRYSSDATFPVKGKEWMRVLTAIAADPLAAAQLYGHETKRCCICHRKLTRRLSRELGIGPVCGGRNEWLTEDMIHNAEQAIIAQGYDPKETVA